MKKILVSMLAITMAAFTFTSCEDVPEPYPIPGGGSEMPEGVYIDKDFSKSLDGFTQTGTNSNISWIIDYNSACITGFKDYDGSGTKSNQAGVTWLVSNEVIDLTNAESAYVEINHALNYEKGDINANNSVLISKDYAGNADAATWELLTYNTDGLNTGFTFATKTMNIPESFIGEKVYIALRHTCTETFSSTWEVKRLSVKEGTADEPETPDTGEPDGDGTATNPFNVAAAIKYIKDDGSEEKENYVKGIVVSVDEGSFDPSYGSLKYYISDDGTIDNQFRVYNGYAGPNRTKFSGEDALKPGDAVVICGKLVNYNGTLEFTTGNYIVSINGNDINGGGGEEQPTDGVYINETFSSSFGSFTVHTIKGTPWVIDSYGYAKATGYDNASKTTTPSESYIVSKAVNMSSAKEATVTFDYILRYVTTTDGETIDGIKNKVLVTANYTGDPATTQWTDITGTLTEVRDWKTWTKFTADVPAEIKGKNNVVFALYYACGESSGTWEVKNFTVKEGKAEGEGGGNEPSGGEVTENSITITAASLGLSNGQEAGTLTLIDGTVLTFDGGGNNNVPKYYNSGTNIRMYPKNSVKITSAKKIVSVVLNCDKLANGTIFNASGDVSANPGTVNLNGTTITVNGINTNETVITNVSTTSGEPSQIRFVSMTINYEK